MNAANEEAVYLFLDKKISLWQIYEITKKMMDSHTNILNPSLEQILETDMIIRDFVKKSTAN